MKTVFEVLDSKFIEELDALGGYIVAGKARDFAEYRHVCGQILGLMTAQSLNNDLAQQYREDDDDE
jgi:hypothetical protein